MDFSNYLSLGTYRLNQDDTAARTVIAAANAGVRKFATSRSYYNDYLLSILFDLGIDRSNVEINLKLSLSDLASPKLLTANLNSCLRRMKVEYVDTLMIELTDDENHERIFDTTMEHKEAGLVRRIGLSNPDVKVLRQIEGGKMHEAISAIMIPASKYEKVVSLITSPKSKIRLEIFAPFGGGKNIRRQSDEVREHHLKKSLSIFRKNDLVVHFGASQPYQVREVIAAWNEI